MSNYANKAFMEQAEAVISSTPNHPLHRLIDPSTGQFWGRTAFKDIAEIQPTVQAGHTVSRFAGGERLAVEDAYSNWLEGLAERKLHVHLRDAVDIGGVPVEKGTALLYEKLNVIPPGTVAHAKPMQGWNPGDKLTAEPWDGPTFPTGPATESLPGGAEGAVTLTGAGMTAGASQVLDEGMIGGLLLLAAGAGLTLGVADLYGLRPDRDESSASRSDPPTKSGPSEDRPSSAPSSKEPVSGTPTEDTTRERRTVAVGPKRVLIYTAPVDALRKAARDNTRELALASGSSKAVGTGDADITLKEAARAAAERQASGSRPASPQRVYNNSAGIAQPPIQLTQPAFPWLGMAPPFPQSSVNSFPMIQPPIFAPQTAPSVSAPMSAPMTPPPSMILPSWIFSALPTPTPPPQPPQQLPPIPQFIYAGPPLGETVYVDGSNTQNAQLFTNPQMTIPF